jgi:hypothetical protein
MPDTKLAEACNDGHARCENNARIFGSDEKLRDAISRRSPRVERPSSRASFRTRVRASESRRPSLVSHVERQTDEGMRHEAV